MKKIYVIIIFCACLFSNALAATPLVNNGCNELVQYAENVIKTTAIFEQKYGNKLLLECIACKKEKLTHGDFLGLVLMQSIDAFVNPDKPNAAKTNLDEALAIFPQKTLEELVHFMLRVANELQIICAKCGEKNWKICEATQ